MPSDDRTILVRGDEFLRDLVPPSYVIEPIIQRGYICSLTGQTGHGKSAVTHLLTLCVVDGKRRGHLKPVRGRVLLMLGENADNVKLQLKAAAEHYGLPESLLEWITVYRVSKPIDEAVADIMRQAGKGQWGEFALVIIDTSAAYFGGEDENSNAAMREHANYQRMLTRLPGNPGVIANCHPKLTATRDNMIPRGGSAYLSEIDGNVTLWNDGGLVTIHHSPKFRGPPFDAFSFSLLDHQLTFDNGMKMSVPVAIPLSDEEQFILMGEHAREERAVLSAMKAGPEGSTRDWARTCEWKLADGTPHHVKVVRALKRLEVERKVKRWGSKWILASADQ